VAANLRLIRLVKTTVLISALWTLCCAILLIGLQVRAWWRDGIWNSYSILALIKGDPDVTYTTASYTEPTIVDRLLEIPAIVPLIIVATFFRALHGWLAEIEKRSSIPRR
jgi:hypothetical protein